MPLLTAKLSKQLLRRASKDGALHDYTLGWTARRRNEFWYKKFDLFGLGKREQQRHWQNKGKKWNCLKNLWAQYLLSSSKFCLEKVFQQIILSQVHNSNNIEFVQPYLKSVSVNLNMPFLCHLLPYWLMKQPTTMDKDLKIQLRDKWQSEYQSERRLEI